MIMNETHIAVILRGLLLALAVGTGALFGELIFVYGMRLFGHQAAFTSFFAVCLFSGLSGFIPVLPSPSLLSSAPIGLFVRFALLIEFTLLVMAAIVVSSKFMAENHIVISIDIWFAAYAYVLVLVIMLVANFGRLRHEALL